MFQDLEIHSIFSSDNPLAAAMWVDETALVFTIANDNLFALSIVTKKNPNVAKSINFCVEITWGKGK